MSFTKYLTWSQQRGPRVELLSSVPPNYLGCQSLWNRRSWCFPDQKGFLFHCKCHSKLSWSFLVLQAPHSPWEQKHRNPDLVWTAHAQRLKALVTRLNVVKPNPCRVSWRICPMLVHSGDPRLTLCPLSPTRPTKEKHPGPPMAVMIRWDPTKSAPTFLQSINHLVKLLTGISSKAHPSWSFVGPKWCCWFDHLWISAEAFLPTQTSLSDREWNHLARK